MPASPNFAAPVAVTRGVFSLLTLGQYPGPRSDLNKIIGYIVVGKKTIIGYIDDKKNKKEETSFNGCDYDRLILFDDQRVLRCRSYGYSYAYRPNAFLFAKVSSLNSGTRAVTGADWKMCVDGDLYDMEFTVANSKTGEEIGIGQAPAGLVSWRGAGQSH